MQISEFVFVDEGTSCVRFFGGNWIKVQDLDAWITSFQEECNRIAKSDDTRPSNQIEEEAFSLLTSI